MILEQSSEYKKFKNYFKEVCTIIYWTLLVLLILFAIFLLYYYIAIKLYETKGDKYEPKFSIYTVVSGSMEPTIKVYDVIVNTKITNIDEVSVNDVITFISTSQVNKGMTVTHRVIGTKKLDDGSTCLITRGDNNIQEDSACVKKENIIGVTKAVIPGFGKVQMILANRFGWLLIVIVPSLYVIIKDILKILNLSKEIKNDEKNKAKKRIKKQ